MYGSFKWLLFFVQLEQLRLFKNLWNKLIHKILISCLFVLHSSSSLSFWSLRTFYRRLYMRLSFIRIAFWLFVFDVWDLIFIVILKLVIWSIGKLKFFPIIFLWHRSIIINKKSIDRGLVKFVMRGLFILFVKSWSRLLETRLVKRLIILLLYFKLPIPSS